MVNARLTPRASSAPDLSPAYAALMAPGLSVELGMGAFVQRKVFRIEQMERRAPVRAAAPVPPVRRDEAVGGDLLKRELKAIRTALSDTLRDLSALLTEGKERRMARAAGELGAAVEAMEKATDNILKSAEAIDECAKALGVAQKSDYERGLAQDIQEHATRLFEACNFQDLAGQRIGKVIATLGAVEQRMMDTIARGKGAPQAAAVAAPAHGLLNGPRLDGAGGHVDQADIDKMFG